MVGAVIFLLALFLFVVLYRAPVPGQAVSVTTPDRTVVLSLAEENTYIFTGKDDQTLTLRIEHGTAQVMAADCPDKRCLHTGAVHNSGEVIACVPAGIVIRITGSEGVDAIAR